MAEYVREDLNCLIREFQTYERRLHDLKQEEYVRTDVNCFANFDAVSKFMNMLPEQVCMIYLMKHIQSLQNAIVTGKYEFVWTQDVTNVEGLKQRIADIRNYLLLLAGILDRKDKLKRGDVE